MKKLVLALVSSVVVAGAASAHGAHINTGWYLGIHGGWSATTSKFTYFDAAQAVNSGSGEEGSNTGNFGVHGGYGYVTGCFYVGGELAYTFDSVKVTTTLGQMAGFSQTQLKRNGYGRGAVRGGYLFTPSTMGYVTLGGNWGRWTANDTLSSANFSNANPAFGRQNRLSFAPGLGLETAVHRNVYLRIEYTYEFGPGVQLRGNPSIAGNNNRFSNFGTVRQQATKLGLSYKF